MEVCDSATFQFQHPFNMLVSGPSQSGKTVWTKQLVRHIDSMCTQPPEKIIWAYGEMQDAYEEMCTWPRMQLVEGLPSMESLKSEPRKPKLLILDDQMMNVKKDTLANIFCKGSHHWSLSCCMLVQSAFYEGLKTPRRNAHYMVLFKNPADALQVSTLARQIFPGKKGYFMESYADATSQPYSYLLLDLKQTTPDRLRLRSCVFPHETNVVYLPK